MRSKYSISVASFCDTGTSHLYSGIDCQDSICVRRKKDVSCCVLSDGAGSSRFASTASQTVARMIATTLIDKFDYYARAIEKYSNNRDHQLHDSICRPLINDCIRYVKHGNKTLPDNDYYATLLAVAVKGDVLIYFHVGDGVILQAKDGMVEVISAPDNGEFSNSTYFVTDSSVSTHFRFGLLNIADVKRWSVFIMSDGLEKCFYQRGAKTTISNNLINWLSDCSCILSNEVMTKVLEYVVKSKLSKYTADDVSIGILSLNSDVITDEILNIKKGLQGSTNLVKKFYPMNKKNEEKMNPTILSYYEKWKESGFFDLLKNIL